MFKWKQAVFRGVVTALCAVGLTAIINDLQLDEAMPPGQLTRQALALAIWFPIFSLVMGWIEYRRKWLRPSDPALPMVIVMSAALGVAALIAATNFALTSLGFLPGQPMNPLLAYIVWPLALAAILVWLITTSESARRKVDTETRQSV